MPNNNEKLQQVPLGYAPFQVGDRFGYFKPGPDGGSWLFSATAEEIDVLRVFIFANFEPVLAAQMYREITALT